jgi:L-seryl-tRNA(Ser) seleniumtransferase
MSKPALRAMLDGAAEAVSLEQLQAAASRRIAQITGAEAGLVTAGCSAALTLGAAAILTGYDAGKMESLPRCDRFAHEFLIAREQRNGYDHAVRAAGAVLVEVGFNEQIAGAGVRRTEGWEYAAAVTANSAGILYVQSAGSQPPLAQVVEVARRHRLPVLVDGAGALPPEENLTALVASGADLVAFSGGKLLRGPQSTGILCGKRALVGPAALQMLDMDDHPQLWEPPEELFDQRFLSGVPRHGIGRGLKVSKEEIAALLTALDQFVSADRAAERRDQIKLLEDIAARLTSVCARCRLSDLPGALPRLEVAIDEGALKATAFDVCRRLRQGQPPIYVGHARLAEGILVINPFCLTPADARVLTERLVEVLSARPVPPEP